MLLNFCSKNLRCEKVIEYYQNGFEWVKWGFMTKTPQWEFYSKKEVIFFNTVPWQLIILQNGQFSKFFPYFTLVIFHILTYKEACDSNPTQKPPTVAPTPPSGAPCDENKLPVSSSGLWKCSEQAVGARTRKICGFVCAQNQNMWKSAARIKCFPDKDKFEPVSGFQFESDGICP